jgi:hypothetical protein
MFVKKSGSKKFKKRKKLWVLEEFLFFGDFVSSFCPQVATRRKNQPTKLSERNDKKKKKASEKCQQENLASRR